MICRVQKKEIEGVRVKKKEEDTVKVSYHSQFLVSSDTRKIKLRANEKEQKLICGFYE